MEKLYFEIFNDNNDLIKFDLRKKIYSQKSPLNIILHGFKAFRNWGFIPRMAEKLSEQSGPTINLDFSLNGVIDEGKMLYDNSKFRKNTISQELKDLNILLDYIKSNNFNINLSECWNGEINLIGHSLGGAISIITAHERNDINKIILWNSISKSDRNTERQKKEWREKGYIEFTESKSGQTLFLDVEYLEDKERNKKRFDLRGKISELKIPICIIQGKLDLTVRYNEAEALEKSAVNSISLEAHYIEKCNHTFGVSNPFISTNENLDYAINKTIEFINK